MTIVDIEVLLHYYYSPEAYPQSSPAVEKSVTTLIACDLLQRRLEPSSYGSTLEVTARGQFWVDTIRNTPLPEQVTTWIIPERGA